MLQAHRQARGQTRCSRNHDRQASGIVRSRLARPTHAASTAKSATARASGSSEPIVEVYYRTGWSSAFIHGSVQGSSWRDHPLNKVTSAPGKWLRARIELKGSATDPLMEFVVTDSNGNWDKPVAGGNYQITAPGSYTLRGGALAPVSGTPAMIVSDLDGTMVGDDGATAAFKKWWEDAGVVRGGVLVYNTGRSLDSFTALQKEKVHCLAHPDVLISAVGTKIYTHQGGSWQEEAAWVKLLAKGWEAQVARDAAYSALAKVGKEVMHFRPAEEQGEHKITCGVACSVLQQVTGHLQGRLDEAGVEANVIVSGKGDWRFLDIVPKQAGKLEALEYVRKRYSFPVETTVACGDSGNDILMLSGKNPAVVVGNAQPDLLEWVEARLVQEAGAGARLLVATEHEALGILQCLDRLGLK